VTLVHLQLTNLFSKEQAEVRRSLPSLLFPYHQPLRDLTFFITPEFIKWFDEDSDFMPQTLDHIHANWSASKYKLSNRSLPEGHQNVHQLRVAVVDRLPFPNGNSSGCPGISLSITPWKGARGRKDRAAKISSLENPEAVPLISARLAALDNRSEGRYLRVVLRPANTLFVNGLRSTMFEERWVCNNEMVSGPRFSRHTARQYVSRMSLNHTSQGSSLRLPLYKLTDSKEISTCMGNVISKLAGNQDAEPTSASLELEQQVAAFMKSKNTTSGTLSVFALIIPKSRPQTDSLRGQALYAESLGHHQGTEADEVVPERLRTLDSIRLAISKGAHVHKVTSGGGGWGKKQGLLSLEPAMDFGEEGPDTGSPQLLKETEESSAEMPLWDPHSPEVAQPGDRIEFYGIFLSQEEETALIRKETLNTALKAPDAKYWHSRTWAQEDVSNVIWGVISPQDSNVASTISALGNKLIIIPHQFGMLSESGMVLQKMQNKIERQGMGQFAFNGVRITNMTRIDVPHALVTYSVQNE
jgi:hypothetical protein